MGCNHSNNIQTKLSIPNENHEQIVRKVKDFKKKDSVLSEQNVTTERKDTNRAEIGLKSAILIQRWYRRYLARLEARRRCTWQIFQSLEYVGEQDQLKLYRFFQDILEQKPLLETFNSSQSHSFTCTIRNKLEQKYPTLDCESDLMELTDPESCPLEPSYRGPFLNFPLTNSEVKVMIEAFKLKKILPAKYVLQILHDARVLLKNCTNIRLADTSISKKITVCGDFHGKLEDLLVVMNKNGFPSNQNPYVFNGDFVDRGKHSIEVALILMSFFILYPDSVYLNRGNHEDCLINLRYGFQKEILYKYRKTESGKILAIFSDYFCWLPFGTIIDDKIFVCHGGVSEETDLAYIQTIKRQKYISLLKPIHNQSMISGQFNDNDQEEQNQENDPSYQENVKEWKQLIDLLWNDPMTRPGECFNYIRGGGLMFGPDVTANFLAKHDLSLLIRSHECKPKGYEFAHNNKLLTIFSASNYYELGSNNGAFVQIDSQQNLHFVEYISSEHIYKYSINQRLSLFEESAIRSLKKLFFSHKSDLMAEFTKYDPKHTGILTMTDWCLALENILHLNLPWRIICKNLVNLDRHNNVLYESMFEDIKGAAINKFDGVPMMEAIYRNKVNLENIFRLIDTDNSGVISLAEFSSACEFLGKHAHISFSNGDVEILAKSLDLNNDGFIDLNEFLEAFRLVNEPADITTI